MLIQKQIEAGHVNTLRQGVCQVNVDLNIGVNVLGLVAVFHF